MKRLFFILAATLPLLVACRQSGDQLPIVKRAFLALPDDVFQSISASIADASARKTLAVDGNYETGSNEDTRSFSLNYDAEVSADELNVCCFQDPVFCYIQMYIYKMEAEDDWFVLYDVAEKLDEGPAVSLLTKGYRFDAKKNILEETGLRSEPYSKQDFYDPVASWPYLKSGDEVKSTHIAMLDFGYYVCPNIEEADSPTVILDPTPFSVKYVWDGEKFCKAGLGTALGFVDHLAAFNVLEQKPVPFDFEFPGCRMESLSEEGYNNVPIRHFDLYQGDERLIRMDPFSLSDDEGRFILMQITSYSSRYTTSEGYGVGSLMKEILQAPTYFGMDALEFTREEETLEDGRKALAIRFPGYEAEMLFVTDAPEISLDNALVSEVIIRPIAKG